MSGTWWCWCKECKRPQWHSSDFGCLNCARKKDESLSTVAQQAKERHNLDTMEVKK